MTKKEFVKIFKRFFITFLICLPIFVLIGVFLTGKISNFLIILMYVVIGAVAFVIEELWWAKHQKKLEQRREEAKLKRKYKNFYNVTETEQKDKKGSKSSDKKDSSNKHKNEEK